MKQLSKLMVATAAAVAAWMPMQAQTLSPMSKAVIEAYTGLIAEDPSDYMSYYSRANEYYNANDYIKALDDINAALRYTPAEETAQRFQCYVTRSNINDRLHRYADAISDLRSALALDPQCVACSYRMATMEYELGNYASARTEYERLNRMMPRNSDILFGLARVAVKENNLGLAANYADEAVELARSKSEAYIQRAGVRSLMQNNEGAVDDYILAISHDDSNTPAALRALVKLADTNYPAVINGLSRAIKAAPRSGSFYYIRAGIAQKHGNYLTAISDLNTILDNNLDGYAGLNYSLAECYFALGQYDNALTNIDYAIGSTASNAEYFALKANIRNAVADYDGAIFAADKALEINPDCTDAIVAKSMAMVGKKDYNEASVLLAEAIMNRADDPALYLLRAWVAATLQQQPKVSKELLRRALDTDVDQFTMESMRGFALLQLDDEAAAERWLNDVLATDADPTGRTAYYAACFYARQGNKAKAFEQMESSLRKGYANYHQWHDLDYGYVNVAPLRKLPEFNELLNRYASIFGR